MRTSERIVIETNVFVSAALLPLSVPRQVVDKSLNHGVLLFSEATISELAEVLLRPKFERYVSSDERALFLRQLRAAAEFVHIIRLVRECRDPEDDKFMEVALNGRADAIITGDADLLALNPWRGIEIVTPAEYLSQP